MKKRVFAEHTDETRDSRWTLIQQDDGTLHVEQEAKYPDGNQKRRTVSINEFMLESGPLPRWLQKVIDRMFEDV